MEDETSRWRGITQTWEERIDAAGLTDLVYAVRTAMHPLAPLAAQFLWFVQPAFALFGKYQIAGELAETLANPGTPGQPIEDEARDG